MVKQSRNWMFTCNYEDLKVAEEQGSDHIDLSEDPLVKYIVYQEEIGKEGTYHIQGFLQLSKSRAASYVHRLCNRCHWNIANDPKKAMEYCKKDDETRIGYPIEIGEFTGGQGTRNDIHEVKEKIAAGKTMQEIADEHLETYLKYHRGLQAYQSMKQSVPPPVEMVELRPWQEHLFSMLEEEPKMRRIFWIWSSESNTGKTTTTKLIYNKYWGKVMPGSMEYKRTLYAYSGHRFIIFDCSRASPHDAQFLSQIESLSNMTVHLSEMHTPVMKTVVAHIIVFSNRPPPIDKLPDRIVEFHVE